MSVGRLTFLRAASTALCLIGSDAVSEEYSTDIGPLKAYYDERLPMFDGFFGSDYGGVRIVFPDGSEVPFSNENEAAVRQVLIAFCADTTGLAEFDEFLFVRDEMVGRCYDMKAEGQ